MFLNSICGCQLFKLVNQLLQSTAATRQRRLQIRTYNVVPLT
jgi:phosphatidylinositol kinase/protein kinase (PI-3  family)